jgi:hypothetical protein
VAVNIDDFARRVADHINNSPNNHTWVDANTDQVDGHLTEVIWAVLETLDAGRSGGKP